MPCRQASPSPFSGCSISQRCSPCLRCSKGPALGSEPHPGCSPAPAGSEGPMCWGSSQPRDVTLKRGNPAPVPPPPKGRAKTLPPSPCCGLQGTAGAAGCDQGCQAHPGTDPAHGARDELLFLGQQSSAWPGWKPLEPMRWGRGGSRSAAQRGCQSWWRHGKDSIVPVSLPSPQLVGAGTLGLVLGALQPLCPGCAPTWAALHPFPHPALLRDARAPVRWP